MKKIIGISLLCLMVSLITVSHNARAAEVEIAEQPCDTNYWESLTSRAWLEAEREIMQNQNLIFKADSVLEYTCFDRFSASSAEFSGAIFSDEDGVQRLDNGLIQTVNLPAMRYIRDNFGHLYLGGRAEELGADPVDRVLDFSPGGYACEEMAGVWQAAKCANLLHTELFASVDGFYPFVDLIGLEGPDVAGYTDINETRIFPLECGGTGLFSWGPQHAFAVNAADALYGFHIPLGLVYEDVAFKLDPALCLEPILTGVEVITSTGPKGPDGVCTNPGCTYISGGCVP